MRRFLFMAMLGMACLLLSCVAPGPSVQEVAEYNKLLEEHGSPMPPDVDAIPELTPDVVNDIFNRDKKEADALYGNKWMKIRGTLTYGPTNRGFHGMNIHYVGLSNNEKSMAFLFFGTSHQEQLARLINGQTLVIIGTYTPGEKYFPKLIGCSLLSVE